MLIRSRSGAYRVEINTGCPHSLFPVDASEGAEACFFVVDQNVFLLYPELFSSVKEESLFLFEALEANKTIEYALKLCERLIESNVTRKTTVVAVGGGILQDVVGFVASVMYRGLPWVFYPTTLLAQADSCIGGKTSLNFQDRKNLLGTFYPPLKIYISSEFVITLSEEDFRSGLGEIIKLHIIDGEDKFKALLQAKTALFERDLEVLTAFIESSLALKKRYIEEDEHDLGLRKILNFGHTFGHAIEACMQFKIPHGQAVLMGIVIANTISAQRGYLSLARKERIEELCLEALTTHLPAEGIDVKLFYNVLLLDKKREGKAIVGVLLHDDLKAELVKDLTHEEIERALIEASPLLMEPQGVR